MKVKAKMRLNREQKLYVSQATSEYLTSLLVRGSFLAALTRELVFSDSLTGILTPIVSLGCLFQLLSVIESQAGQSSFSMPSG